MDNEYNEWKTNKTNMGRAEIIYKQESYNITGALFNVHNKLGRGFLESVYLERSSIYMHGSCKECSNAM